MTVRYTRTGPLSAPQMLRALKRAGEIELAREVDAIMRLAELWVDTPFLSRDYWDPAPDRPSVVYPGY